jgi:hypothetical protein
VKRGQRILAGYCIGTVGDSGNAKGTPPHLHYGIYSLMGKAINPFPLLHSNIKAKGNRLERTKNDGPISSMSRKPAMAFAHTHLYQGARA